MTDGYPTDEELTAIQEWDPEDYDGLIEYLKERWRWESYIVVTENTAKISTGGWSGHESMIAALGENTLWWLFYWYSSRVGGHHVFRRRPFDPKRRRYETEAS